ncbi:hypothetical protein [Nocardia otitidiscaviarum]|uniref:hypothetical protein n=1 Tax=Nocardia otitidiscaviarum TaxID=1823 RepID=UPI0018945F39|nr:hypothetical protein [Nocardia otitidiscaviarum]MBF6179114.1 hypothetical protein [Nocardia otitidiscaviarum]
MARAGMWTVGMAFAPVGFGVGVVVATGILNEVAARSVATDIAGNWMVVMVFGAVLFLPGIVFALFGASMLWGRTGTVTAILGLVLLSLPPLLFAAAGIEEAVGPQRDPYSPSWTARLSLSAALVYALPFVALVLGNAFATWMVWSGRAARR